MAQVSEIDVRVEKPEETDSTQNMVRSDFRQSLRNPEPTTIQEEAELDTNAMHRLETIVEQLGFTELLKIIAEESIEPKLQKRAGDLPGCSIDTHHSYTLSSLSAGATLKWPKSSPERYDVTNSKDFIRITVFCNKLDLNKQYISISTSRQVSEEPQYMFPVNVPNEVLQAFFENALRQVAIQMGSRI